VNFKVLKIIKIPKEIKTKEINDKLGKLVKNHHDLIVRLEERISYNNAVVESPFEEDIETI